MIGRRYASNLLDVRTFRGPNMDTDHFFVAAKVRMRISTIALWYAEKAKPQKVANASDGSAQHSDKLREPQSSPDDIGGQWVNISHSLRASAEAVVGFERPPKWNQWHDEECRTVSEKGRPYELRQLSGYKTSPYRI